jgi:hypothetical protein
MFEIVIGEDRTSVDFGTSSKGNQLKWKIDGWWYKADGLGYEGFAEVAVSRILSYSNLDGVTAYEPGMIQYRGQTYHGCRSRDFCRENERLVTLEQLSRAYSGFGLHKELARMSSVETRVRYTVELVENLTGLSDFGGYLTKLLEMDAFFLNEDRHTNNIAVLYDEQEKSYRLCPFFDMGLSLLADRTWAYPPANKPEAKPFSRDFDEQMDAAERLYGDFLRIHLSKKEMEDVARRTGEETGYNEEDIARVTAILREQARKYGYIIGD